MYTEFNLELKLMLKPLLITSLGIAVYLLLGCWLPTQLMLSRLTMQMAQSVSFAALAFSLGLILYAVFLYVSRLHQLIGWYDSGKSSCPKCGLLMIDKYTRHKGVFKGCIRYPSCNGQGGY